MKIEWTISCGTQQAPEPKKCYACDGEMYCHGLTFRTCPTCEEAGHRTTYEREDFGRSYEWTTTRVDDVTPPMISNVTYSGLSDEQITQLTARPPGTAFPFA